MQKTINQLRAAQQTLLAGCTYDELADALGGCCKSARRMVAALRTQGCVIDEQLANSKGKLTLKMRSGVSC